MLWYEFHRIGRNCLCKIGKKKKKIKCETGITKHNSRIANSLYIGFSDMLANIAHIQSRDVLIFWHF